MIQRLMRHIFCHEKNMSWCRHTHTHTHILHYSAKSKVIKLMSGNYGAWGGTPNRVRSFTKDLLMVGSEWSIWGWIWAIKRTGNKEWEEYSRWREWQIKGIRRIFLAIIYKSQLLCVNLLVLVLRFLPGSSNLCLAETLWIKWNFSHYFADEIMQTRGASVGEAEIQMQSVWPQNPCC